MKYLNGKDLLKLLDYQEMISCIEKAFGVHNDQSYNMPDRIHVNYNENTLLYMPCILKEKFGTKFVTVFPNNKNISKPVVDGLMILNDGDTGEILGMLDGKVLTAVRTGAVGGVAIKHLSKKSSKVLGIIGAGVQGYYQVLFGCNVRNFEKVIVYDHSNNYGVFIKKIKEKLDVKIIIAKNSKELVKESDVIVTTTTSNEPVIPSDADFFGKTFIGIGSYKPNMREYPNELFNFVEDVYVDTEFAGAESGDLKIPLEKGLIKQKQIVPFSKVMGIEMLEETVFFKSVGMALFDVLVAEMLYEKSESENIGVLLEG